LPASSRLGALNPVAALRLSWRFFFSLTTRPADPVRAEFLIEISVKGKL